MKTKLLLIISVFFCMTIESFAQTGLFTYIGGYFIRNGNNWEEYRPKLRDGVWATYTQYDEEENFYLIKNSSCYVCVPKTDNHNFYIYRNDQWEKVYTTREIYNHFTDSYRDIYCYEGGYFVRDGEQWREYKPGKRQGLWNDFTQYSEDDNYFYIRNSSNKVAIPKSTSFAFYICNSDSSWLKLYNTTDIYDVCLGYDFNFFYNSHKTANSNDDWNSAGGKVRLSFNRKGRGVISCGDERYNFTFSSVNTFNIRGTDKEWGFKLKFTEEKYILVFENICRVFMDHICPQMVLSDNTNPSEYERAASKIRNRAFYN